VEGANHTDTYVATLSGSPAVTLQLTVVYPSEQLELPKEILPDAKALGITMSTITKINTNESFFIVEYLFFPL
jgi:hypothetical protein